MSKKHTVMLMKTCPWTQPYNRHECIWIRQRFFSSFRTHQHGPPRAYLFRIRVIAKVGNIWLSLVTAPVLNHALHNHIHIYLTELILSFQMMPIVLVQRRTLPMKNLSRDWYVNIFILWPLKPAIKFAQVLSSMNDHISEGVHFGRLFLRCFGDPSQTSKSSF